MFEQSKPFLKSKTVWGSISVAGVAIAKLAGVDLGDANGWIESGVLLVSAIGSIIGRIKAVKKIKFW